MTTLVTTEPEVTPWPWKWTRDLYERAIDAGVFGEDDPIELIGGEIVEHMSPQKDAHAYGVLALQEDLTAAFGQGFTIRIQLPFVVGDHSEPEPDATVVRGTRREQRKGHPTEAVLVVEVADSSLAYDVSTKASLYASAGVPDYWVLNLPKRQLVVMRDPVAAADQPFGFAYQSVTVLDESAEIEALGAPEKKIKVADLLP
jgi:Uma2 family endonuclease